VPASFSWPGVGAVLSFQYTASVGISPGVAVLEGVPNGDPQGDHGTLGFSDGVASYTLADCRLANFQERQARGGRVWYLTVLDRRWRWEDGYAISGQYNQIDDHGKLIPWTVRSPYQLAELCLDAMGEAGYSIDLPGGLAAPPGPGVPDPGPLDVVIDAATDYLALGENVPQTGTNPPTVWNSVPAAKALAALGDTYGRLVVWDPATDLTSVQKQGEGTGLPDGAVLTAAPAIDPKAVPSQIVIAGAPTRFQVRLAFRAVGRDWDDSWNTPPELTYAPTVNGRKSFERSVPPFFGNVVPTVNLNYKQARQLAESSVFRCYQLLAAHPEDRASGGIPVPSLDADGDVTNRYRLVLQDSRPDQTAPRPGDEARIDPATGQPFAAEVYNGYSKDRIPAAFGSIHVKFTAGGIWVPRGDLDADGNTPAASQIYVPWRIADPERQVIEFAEPIYKVVGQGANAAVTAPEVVVETGVLVMRPDTFAPYQYTHTLDIPGGLGPPRTVNKPDVQYEVIGEYDSAHNLTGWHPFDADAQNRAEYYANAIAATYLLSGALVARYPGVVGVSLSGVVRQVTFELSRDGFFTTASANTEHSTAVVPYGLRRKRENLPPDGLQVIQNLSGFMGPLNGLARLGGLDLAPTIGAFGL
jgi:hypothetical protein